MHRVIDDDAAAAVFLHVKSVEAVDGAHARRPDDGARLDFLQRRVLGSAEGLVAKRFAVVVRDHHRALHGDLFLFKHAHGLVAQLLRHHHEDAGVCADEMDFDLAEVDCMVLLLKDVVDEFGEAARTFDADGARADEDEGQKSLALCRILFTRGFFEDLEDVAADLDGVDERLQGQRVFLDALRAEEVWRRAERDDEMIVVDLALIGAHGLRRRVDSLDFGEQEVDVRSAAEKASDRVDDLVRREHRGRHLIEQRLKDLIVVVVDDEDIDRLVRELSRRTYACNAAAQDDDAWFRCLFRHDSYRLSRKVCGEHCESYVFFIIQHFYGNVTYQ